MKKVVISGMIGNGLEWYDYALYAQFALIIGKHFFPDSTMRETLTLAIFAAGFVLRPLGGGIVLGNIGDIFGRRIETIRFETALHLIVKLIFCSKHDFKRLKSCF